MNYSKWVEKRTGRFLLGTSIFSVGALVLSVLLFLNLRPDMEELLPRNSTSLVDWDFLRGQIRSTDFLAVLVQHPDVATRTQVADALARRLRNRPDPVIAGVDSGPGDLTDWSQKHGAFLLPLATLENLEAMVGKAIRTQEFSDAPFELLKKERSRNRLPAAQFDSAVDATTVVMVHLTPQGSRMDNGAQLKRAVAEELALVPRAPELQVRYSGPVEILAEEHDALIEDLGLSALVTVLLCGGLLVFFFGSVSLTVALLASLSVGVVATFAFGYVAIGYLNSNTAFLASIVVGNGVNFGIIYLARFMEERRRFPQGDWATQLDLAQRETFKGTWTAALAAGLAYGSLLLTDFRGFQQFALLGLVGMILCWLSSMAVLPAILLHFQNRISTPVRRVDPGAALNIFLSWRGTSWGLILFFTVATILAGLQYRKGDALAIETDVSRVRNSESMVSGAGSLQAALERATGSRAPILVWAPTPTALAALENDLRQAVEPGGALHGLAERVLSPSQFLPADQERKAAVLSKLNRHLSKEILQYIPAPQRKELTRFLSSTPVKAEELPEAVRSAFQDRSGQLGKILYVEPVADGQLLAEDRLLVFSKRLREILNRHEGRMAGQLPVIADIVLSIERDGPRATLFALGSVVFLVVLTFRNVAAIFPLLLGLSLAVLWLLGGMSFLDLRMNFINFIALPITFGIGVDYSVNLYQRYLRERKSNPQRRLSMLNAVSNSGGAVITASVTTVIGYGSLLVARNQGFVSLGWVAVLGELTCLASAVLLLPALVLGRKDP